MTLELTDQEAEIILKFVDVGLKSNGIAAIEAANLVIAKIKHAKANENTYVAGMPAPAAGAGPN